jgi:hypothetical protein
MDVAKELLQLCKDEEVEFFDRLITRDECWVYHYDPETKEMSKQWKQAEDDVISAVEDFLNSQNETFHDQGIQQQMHR